MAEFSFPLYPSYTYPSYPPISPFYPINTTAQSSTSPSLCFNHGYTPPSFTPSSSPHPYFPPSTYQMQPQTSFPTFPTPSPLSNSYATPSPLSNPYISSVSSQTPSPSSFEMKISIFDGSEDAYWWILCSENSFNNRNRRVSDAEKLMECAFAMKGSALTWWQNWYLTNPKRSWNSFTCALLRQFKHEWRPILPIDGEEDEEIEQTAEEKHVTTIIRPEKQSKNEILEETLKEKSEFISSVEQPINIISTVGEKICLLLPRSQPPQLPISSFSYTYNMVEKPLLNSLEMHIPPAPVPPSKLPDPPPGMVIAQSLTSKPPPEPPDLKSVSDEVLAPPTPPPPLKPPDLPRPSKKVTHLFPAPPSPPFTSSGLCLPPPKPPNPKSPPEMLLPPTPVPRPPSKPPDVHSSPEIFQFHPMVRRLQRAIVNFKAVGDLELTLSPPPPKPPDLKSPPVKVLAPLVPPPPPKPPDLRKDVNCQFIVKMSLHVTPTDLALISSEVFESHLQRISSSDKYCILTANEYGRSKKFPLCVHPNRHLSIVYTWPAFLNKVSICSTTYKLSHAPIIPSFCKPLLVCHVICACKFGYHINKIMC